jgi:uncharacterized protein YegL
MPVTVTSPDRRMYPVVFLLDTSGSMVDDGKIEVLNASLRGALDVLRPINDPDVEIWVAVITFNTNSELHTPLTLIDDVVLRPLTAVGRTSFGHGLERLVQLLEGEAIPGNAYPPTLVLVSDGYPTDEYDAVLRRLTSQPRFAAALRLAIRLGADCDVEHLRAFTGTASAVFSVSELVTLPDLMVRSARAVEDEVSRTSSSRRATATRAPSDG